MTNDIVKTLNSQENVLTLLTNAIFFYLIFVFHRFFYDSEEKTYGIKMKEMEKKNGHVS